VKRVADAPPRLGALAEITHFLPRTMRDRLLMPVARLFATNKATALLWQEPLDALRTMGTR
jgi:hypothetical protein